MTPSFGEPRKMVQDFHTAFDLIPSADLWLKLIDEEYKELGEAMALYLTDDTIESLENVLKEACDLMYVLIGSELVFERLGIALTEDAGEAILRPVAAVIAVVGADKFHEAFKRVHESNMSKLDDDGKPLRREDGKVLKGPNYKPPVLTDLVSEAYLTARADAPNV